MTETDLYDDDNMTAEAKPKTQKQLISKRKLVAKLHNQATFSNVKVGIHGKTLPTFFADPKNDYSDQLADRDSSANKTVDWWKSRPNVYNSKPSNVSQREMQQNQRYWAKPDEIYLADKKLTAPPPDTFKQIYSAKAKNTDER